MSSEPLDLLYVLVDIALTLDNSPVFQSQVLDRIRVQHEAGIKVGVITTVDDPLRFAEVVEAPLRHLGVMVYSFPDNGLLRNLLSARRALRVFCKNPGASHVYARGIWGSFVHRMAFPLGGPALIYDFRGDIVAETAARGASRLRQALLRILCRAAFSGVSTMLTVSRASTTVLASDYGCSNVVVLPSAVDALLFQHAEAKRHEMRQALGAAKTDVLLIYAGGLSHYQMVPEMLEVWRDLSRLPNVRFVLLTSQQPMSGCHSSLDLVDRIPRLIHASVPRSEVPSYLAATDIGFLLREEHPLNAVASPVKFGEYLATGLAVVTSPGLGDVSRIVCERDLGVLVRPKDREHAVIACSGLIERVRHNRDGFRQRALQAVREERWDWQAHMDVWRELLGRPVSGV